MKSEAAHPGLNVSPISSKGDIEDPFNLSNTEKEFDTKTEEERYIKKISDEIVHEVRELYKNKNSASIDNLLSYDSKKWLDDRPQSLVYFLSRLYNISKTDLIDESKWTFFIARIVELIYSATNARILLPIAFSENLQTYSLWHSKLLVQYNNSVSPGGSYALQKWILAQASNPVPVPDGLLKCVFDNEQVVGKTRLIQSENKVPLSIITSHAYLQIDPDSTEENEIALCPRLWLFKNPLPDNVKGGILGKFDEETTLLRKTRILLSRSGLSL